MPLQLVSPPGAEPVTLEDMAAHVRQDSVDEDDYLESLISAAREVIEQSTGRAFYDQTWKLTLRDFPSSGFIRLPKSPLLEVVSVTYRDTDGNYQILQENVDYYVDLGSEPGTIDPGDGSWRVTGCYPDGVAIVFRAGYTDTSGSPFPDDVVPARAKIAIKQLAAWWYEQREPVVTGTIATRLPLHVERIVRSLRVYGDG